jgi:signal peptidase I
MVPGSTKPMTSKSEVTIGATRPGNPALKSARSKTHEGSWRESIETFVVTFIIAYVVKSFAFEAFVIPTGSMAPTLMGRHKEIDCPQCGYRYAVNASESMGSTPVIAGTCVNCRYTADVSDEPNFKGDRILVLKTLFDLPEKVGGGSPKRWDVTVFKYPEEPETNYIKRLVGMPNEELRIFRGDILTRPLGSSESFEIQRKGLDHLRAMQILVHDDAHHPKALAEDPRWNRWRVDEGGWKKIDDGVYGAESQDEKWSDLRYENRVPTPDQWNAIAKGSAIPGEAKPTLITDYYAYNTFQFDDDGTDKSAWFQPHWVGDLTVEFVLQVDKPTGEFRAELVKAGVPYQFIVDLSNGFSRLMCGDDMLSRAQTPIREGGRYRIRFANVDNRLTVWINHLTPFGDGIPYEIDTKEPTGPQAADLRPVGLAVRNGKVSVSRLKLSRDIYYTLHPSGYDYSENLWNTPILSSGDLFELLSDPKKFSAYGNVRHVDFPIGPGRYMMMGDNSPLSKDSRAWSNADRKDPNQPGAGWDDSNRERWEVPEKLIVGKAFMVYWPHAQPFWPRIRFSEDFVIPFRPYFERMKVIR